MIIRPINQSVKDIKAVMAIDALTFKDCPYSAEEIIERIDFDAYPMMVAEENEMIIGFISFMKVQTLHYSGLWIDLVAVTPEEANRGVGKQLIHAGEVLSRELGVDFRSALIREDNISSIKAFEAEGFEWDQKPFRLYSK